MTFWLKFRSLMTSHVWGAVMTLGFQVDCGLHRDCKCPRSSGDPPSESSSLATLPLAPPHLRGKTVGAARDE